MASRISREPGSESPASANPAPEASANAGEPDVLDLRDLEAPEPMERILYACAALAPGEVLRARTPRYPRMLVPHLEERELEWSIEELSDGSALVRVRKPG